MILETLAITTNLSMRLFNLGLKQVSAFYWYQEKLPNDPELFNKTLIQASMPWKFSVGKPANVSNIYKIFSAYTSSELGEILPLFIVSVKYKITFTFRGKFWIYRYDEVESGREFIRVSALTEQDARALLLIHILENHYIDLSQIIIK
jgi:hypothetical protein